MNIKGDEPVRPVPLKVSVGPIVIVCPFRSSMPPDDIDIAPVFFPSAVALPAVIETPDTIAILPLKLELSPERYSPAVVLVCDSKADAPRLDAIVVKPVPVPLLVIVPALIVPPVIVVFPEDVFVIVIPPVPVTPPPRFNNWLAVDVAPTLKV